MIGDGIDNGVVRTAADDVRKLTRRAHLIEVALVAVAGAAVVLMAITILAIGQTNRIGVERIVDCTTPGEKCYEDQKFRDDTIVADALARLNEKHLVIECLLVRTPPPQPGQTGMTQREALVPVCEAEARAITERVLAELAERAKQARERAEQGNGGP